MSDFVTVVWEHVLLFILAVDMVLLISSDPVESLHRSLYLQKVNKISQVLKSHLMTGLH